MSELEILKDFPIKVEIQITWVEMDVYGHINNANYFRYFEVARINYFEQTEFYDEYRTHGLAGVLSKTSCNFLVPLTYPDLITTGVRVVELQKDTIRMEHFISSSKTGLSAFGESEIVIFDFNTGKRIDVPVHLQTAIEKLEGKLF